MSKPTIAELEKKIKALEAENSKLQQIAEDAVERVSIAEGNKGPVKTTVIKTKKGKLVFTGNGVNVMGVVYSPERLKNEPEIALELFEKGSELFKKA